MLRASVNRAVRTVTLWAAIYSTPACEAPTESHSRTRETSRDCDLIMNIYRFNCTSLITDHYRPRLSPFFATFRNARAAKLLVVQLFLAERNSLRNKLIFAVNFVDARGKILRTFWPTKCIAQRAVPGNQTYRGFREIGLKVGLFFLCAFNDFVIVNGKSGSGRLLRNPWRENLYESHFYWHFFTRFLEDLLLDLFVFQKM